MSREQTGNGKAVGRQVQEAMYTRRGRWVGERVGNIANGSGRLENVYRWNLVEYLVTGYGKENEEVRGQIEKACAATILLGIRDG